MCAGAGTATPAIQTVNDASESSLPAPGLQPYALGNVLLSA